MRGCGCLIEVGTNYHQFYLVAAVNQDAVALLHWRGLWHKNLAGDSHCAAGISHALRMIAGRGRNNSPVPLLLRQIRHPV